MDLAGIDAGFHEVRRDHLRVIAEHRHLPAGPDEEAVGFLARDLEQNVDALLAHFGEKVGDRAT